MKKTERSDTVRHPLLKGALYFLLVLSRCLHISIYWPILITQKKQKKRWKDVFKTSAGEINLLKQDTTDDECWEECTLSFLSHIKLGTHKAKARGSARQGCAPHEDQLPNQPGRSRNTRTTTRVFYVGGTSALVQVPLQKSSSSGSNSLCPCWRMEAHSRCAASYSLLT